MTRLAFTFVLSFLLLTTIGCAQDNSPANSTAKATIDYPAHNPGWEVDLEKAYQMSQKTGKPILANFTGSDWCGWCIRLTNSVFVKDDFKAWAEKNVILLELDYPRRKKLPPALAKQNAKLQQALQIRGFPTVYLLDMKKDENDAFKVTPLGKTGYKKTVGEFTGELDRYMK